MTQMSLFDDPERLEEIEKKEKLLQLKYKLLLEKMKNFHGQQFKKEYNHLMEVGAQISQLEIAKQSCHYF